MINIKSKSEIERMKDSGKIVAEVLQKIEENILPGITTKELDRIASDYIIKSGAFPSFSACRIIMAESSFRVRSALP